MSFTSFVSSYNDFILSIPKENLIPLPICVGFILLKVRKSQEQIILLSLFSKNE